MSLFQAINNEKNELIHFETLISEIAKQEGIKYSEACAVIAREAADHIDEIPWSIYEPFYLYDYNLVNGFTKSDAFSRQAIEFLKSMAFGAEYAEEPHAKDVYTRIDNGEGWYRAFYFKGGEITLSFLDSGVIIPPCLEKFKSAAELKLQKNKEKRKKENNKSNPLVSINTLKEEIEILKNELNEVNGKIPSMLGLYREDDPLLIAIELRNKEWCHYNEDDRKTTPAQDALVAQVKEQYKTFEMTDIQARAIEKVACPIKRK